MEPDAGRSSDLGFPSRGASLSNANGWRPFAGHRSHVSEGVTAPDASDEALFAGVATGDAAAFAAFYDRHEALWYTVALRILQDPAEAEDVLQEAAILVWERGPQYDPALGRPGSWALTLLRNKAIDRLRSRRRRGNLMERAAVEGLNPEGGEAFAPASIPDADAAAIVRRTLLGLPGEQRRAIELAFFAGLTQSEIAEHLGEPLGTVKARIRRGMLTMRDALEGAL